tara:strand:+ start:41 stop:367 length:327 start_codon:yes stop_codon:yes gene_type:complete
MKQDNLYYGDSTITDIVTWAEDRGLLSVKDNEAKSAQLIKLTEEVGELARAFSKKDRWELVDSIGDCMVVLIVIAYQHDLTVEECLSKAYEEIKDRKGVLKDGYFIKE